ncbi:MAG: cytochrome c biogenesis protein CcsA [Burkholderiaceae bacterium]|nr:MAG: cytochrome C assembly protein [Burkholderiaceae bacterium]MBE7426091.1 cytochrome c biogenesis protein CcsA [Ideonella sp.]MCC7287705.1 cytochrome c biogenesis protein CcsA [Burkholderiaceae bacterium]
MILSSGPLATWLALVALVAYGLAAWPWRGPSRIDTGALAVGWVAHGAALTVDIAGAGHGARIGFAPVLSFTVWMVVLVNAIESRMLPLPAVRRMLALAGCAAVVLAWLFPGEVPLASHSPWAPVHWVLGVVSYGLFGVAVLHAWMLDSAERRMRNRAPGEGTVLGLPLLRLERLTFGFVEAGFVVLTLALLLGAFTTEHWRWDHKTVFSLLGWAVFAALLAGRLLRGWRGRRATRWLYAGAVLLLLAYVGSRFVLEVVLGRPVV